MAETTQTTFAGLRAEGLGAKEPQDSAEVAINCDFHRQMIEPRAGRTVVVGRARDILNKDLGGYFTSGGVRIDGSRSWVQVVPDFAADLTNWAAAICWRPDPGMADWLAADPIAVIMEAVEKIPGAPPTAQVNFRVYADPMGAGAFDLYAQTINASGVVTTSAPISITVANGTDVYRIIGYVLRDYPNPTDTTLGLRVFYNGSPIPTIQEDTFIADPNLGLGTDVRWALGAHGWDELNAHPAYFYQSNEAAGVISDFLFWSGTTGDIDDVLECPTLTWVPWWWNSTHHELMDAHPFIHIRMDKSSSWILEDTGETPGGGNPALAWIHPLPVMEISGLGQGIPDRWVFYGLDKGTTTAPPEVDALEQHALVVALDFRFPEWLGAGLNNQNISILASGDGWYLAIYRTAGGVFQLHLYTIASGGWVPVFLPAAGTLVANTTYRCAVAFDRRVGATRRTYLWLNFGGWIAPIFTGIIHDSTVGVTEKQINFGGFPTVGQYPMCSAIIERMAVGLSPADPNVGALDVFIDDMLSDEPRAPVCTAFIPGAGRTRYGHDDTAISTAFPSCHEVLEINDWLGREEYVRCVPVEMTFSSALGYLQGFHPQKIRGAASYETDEGDFRIAELTDSSITYTLPVYTAPGDPAINMPIEATAMHCYDDEVPVCAQSFRRRVFFFGSSGTRQKFNGDRSCSIGIERPFLFDIDVAEIAKIGVPEAPILQGIHWFKVSLYNSRNGQESNLSNAIPYNVAADASGLLLTLRIGYRDGDDFDEVGIWRLVTTEGIYHLETRVRRSSWPGQESAGWLAYQNFAPIDNRVIVRMSQATLALQPYEILDNNPPPTSLIGCFHNDRLYLVPRDQPELVIWSKRHFVESFPAAQFARVGERAGDEIRALASSSIGLLLFTRRETYLIARGSEDDPTPELISSESGCVSPATIAQSERALIWLSERGVEGLVDGGIQLIARPIRNIFDTFSMEEMRTAKAAVWKRRSQYWIVIGHKLLTFDFERGQWSEGAMGCSWIGSMPLTKDGHEELCSGWWAYLLRQEYGNREDGLNWIIGGTLTPEEEITNASWFLDPPVTGDIFSFAIQGTIRFDDIPSYYFISFSDHIYMNPADLIPICIDRKNEEFGNTYYPAENIPPPVGAVAFMIYRYVPCFYQSHLISAEGVETYKRIKSCRLHWDPESDEDPEPRINVLPDGVATGTGVSFFRPIGLRDAFTNEITWRMLCRTWKFTWSHWGNHWPAHSHVEWLYDLRRKV